MCFHVHYSPSRTLECIIAGYRCLTPCQSESLFLTSERTGQVAPLAGLAGLPHTHKHTHTHAHTHTHKHKHTHPPTHTHTHTHTHTNTHTRTHTHQHTHTHTHTHQHTIYRHAAVERRRNYTNGVTQRHSPETTQRHSRLLEDMHLKKARSFLSVPGSIDRGRWCA